MPKTKRGEKELPKKILKQELPQKGSSAKIGKKINKKRWENR